MLVAAHMTKSPITITPSDTLRTADMRMFAGDFRRLPVVEGDRLVGMLSDRDLKAHNGHYERTRVTAAMSENPLVVAPSASLTEAAERMLAYKIDSLPVVENDKLIGIITTTDLLEAFVELSGNAR